ncbi:MAG UNVERIFIED_CONTAM: hypothetical protein LVQ98_06000 [Rickettsiaceae bacterium]|jgi:tRNA pseudouridine55 synthase
MINGWLNIYKPPAVSSAKAVALIKRLVGKRKVGHAGTLDLEAEGILPIAIGEATKLIQFMMDARKSYRFKVQFGARTDTADHSGQITETTDYIPSEIEAKNVVKTLGKIWQMPPAYSALKIKGVPAYALARDW